MIFITFLRSPAHWITWRLLGSSTQTSSWRMWCWWIMHRSPTESRWLTSAWRIMCQLPGSDHSSRPAHTGKSLETSVSGYIKKRNRLTPSVGGLTAVKIQMFVMCLSPLRSPGILLGRPFTEAMDVWSLGCSDAGLNMTCWVVLEVQQQKETCEIT